MIIKIKDKLKLKLKLRKEHEHNIFYINAFYGGFDKGDIAVSIEPCTIDAIAKSSIIIDKHFKRKYLFLFVPHTDSYIASAYNPCMVYDIDSLRATEYTNILDNYLFTAYKKNARSYLMNYKYYTWSLIDSEFGYRRTCIKPSQDHLKLFDFS